MRRRRRRRRRRRKEEGGRRKEEEEGDWGVVFVSEDVWFSSGSQA